MLKIGQVEAAKRDENVVNKLRKALTAAGIPSESHERVISACEAESLFPAVYSGSELHASSDDRAARIEAALADPNKLPAIRFALGELRRLGVSIEAATDVAALNKAMTDQNLSAERRMGIKTALARAGIID